jgi:hypothetical protein
VAKHVDAAELRVVATAVLAVVADAVLAAQKLPKLCAIWLPHLPACMCTIARKEAAWSQGEREEKGRGEVEKRRKLCEAVW